MATHSNVLAWRIPGMGEPGGLHGVYGVAQSRTRLKRLSSSSSVYMGFLGSSDSKESVCNVGDPDLIPGLGRSPGEGNGYPLQYSGLENSTDRGAWQAAVHGVSKSRTQLSD